MLQGQWRPLPLVVRSTLYYLLMIFLDTQRCILDCRIQRFRSDSGGEFISKEFTKVLQVAGIVREQTAATVYLKKRSPTSALEKGMTPLEVFTGEAPKLTSQIPFGTKGFKHVPKELRTKWEPNSIFCTFLGYEEMNQFRVLTDRKVHVTRDLDLVKAKPSEIDRQLPRNQYPLCRC